jgi:hypothetical protein
MFVICMLDTSKSYVLATGAVHVGVVVNQLEGHVVPVIVCVSIFQVFVLHE